MYIDLESFGFNFTSEQGNFDSQLHMELIKRMTQRAKKEKEKDGKLYFTYAFDKSPARVGFKFQLKEDNIISYEDMTTYLEDNNDYPIEIMTRKEKDKIVANFDDTIMMMYWNGKGEEVESKVKANLTIFPLKLEIYQNEKDYQERAYAKEVGEEVILTNIDIGKISPFFMLMEEGKKRELLDACTPEMKRYDDALMVCSGTVTQFENIVNYMSLPVGENGQEEEVGVSEFFSIKIDTDYGELPIAISKDFLNSMCKGLTEITITGDTILKVYGYINAIII